MKNKVYLIIYFISLAISTFTYVSAQVNESNISIESVSNCKKAPEFSLAKNITEPVFVTNDRIKKGLIMHNAKEYLHGNYSNGIQLDSWKTGTTYGPIIFDESGNGYTAAVPNINTLNNPYKGLNTIYKLDSKTGELAPFYDIPVDTMPNSNNPYGILSLTYDCESKLIYLTTISGSTYENQKGAIMVFNPTSKKIVSKFKNFDAIGIIVLKFPKQKKVFFGNTRSSKLFSLTVSNEGILSNDLKEGVTFDQYNETVSRKLTFNQGMLEIQTTEFYYNLIGLTEFSQRKLLFGYDVAGDSWKKIETKTY